MCSPTHPPSPIPAPTPDPNLTPTATAAPPPHPSPTLIHTHCDTLLRPLWHKQALRAHRGVHRMWPALTRRAWGGADGMLYSCSCSDTHTPRRLGPRFLRTSCPFGKHEFKPVPRTNVPKHACSDGVRQHIHDVSPRVLGGKAYGLPGRNGLPDPPVEKFNALHGARTRSGDGAASRRSVGMDLGGDPPPR